MIHRGFANSLACFEKTILQIVVELLKEDPTRVVFTTGHSLGGALATLCALSLKLQLNTPSSEYYQELLNYSLQQVVDLESDQFLVGCYTYGSPKVGNYHFKKWFDQLVPTTFRFTFVGDVVPSLPPRSPFSFFSKSGCFHVGLRILIDRDGNLLLDPSSTERVIYNALRGYKLARHYKGSYSLGFMICKYSISASTGITCFQGVQELMELITTLIGGCL